jgi:AmpD protein
MRIDKKTGLVQGARQVDSPNCDDRPHAGDPELLVIHGISLPPGEFGGPWIDRMFTNTLPADAHPYFAQIAHLKVSTHLLIRRDGELIQYVPLHMRAWHAGQSCFQGRDACNDYSIGIELEGTDEEAYTEEQYRKLNQLVASLLATYPSLSADRIVGHSDIAPGRKTDPGEAFDWQRLQGPYLADIDSTSS